MAPLALASRAALVAALFLAFAPANARSQSAPPSAPPQAPPAASTQPPPVAPAAQPVDPAPLLSAEALEPGGGRVPLSSGTEAIVDPSSSFRVVLPGRSDDARLSLLDAADALVPAIGMREVGEQTVLTVAPRKQLNPASRYLLRVDGARTRDLHDRAGRAAGPVELQMVVAGSPPEPEKKAAKRRRR